METDDKKATVTQILQRLRDNTAPNTNDLVPLVYDELHAIAKREWAKERADHTLSPTALANEAYLRLADHHQIDWKGRTHFLAIAARTIRRLLVDHARAKHAKKRGEGRQSIPIEEAILVVEERAISPLELEEALSRLAASHPRQAKVVELKIFGGLKAVEIAHELGISKITVRSDWISARTTLMRTLLDDDASA